MTDPVTSYAGLTKPTVGADSNGWGGILNTDMDLIDAMLRNIVPAGVVWPYSGTATGSAPTGFLFPLGQAVSRTTYAALWAVALASITAGESTYGVGDGSTTFTLPDYSNKFLVGAGATFPVGTTGGATSVTPTITVAGHALTQAELPNCTFTVTDSGHTHVVTDPGHGHNDTGHAHGMDSATYLNKAGITFGPGGANITADGSGLTTTGFAVIASATTGLTINSHTTGITVASGGSGSTHTHTASSNAVATLPPYRAVNYIIKT